MTLDDLEVYQEAMRIGEKVWNLVVSWDFLPKDTVGRQLVRAADSIAANLSEGFGRFHFKENRQYGYYSRGSLFETKTWLIKARDRALLPEADFTELTRDLSTLGRRLNAYIQSIGPVSLVKEAGPELYPQPLTNDAALAAHDAALAAHDH